jgi:hypothetical protein
MKFIEQIADRYRLRKRLEESKKSLNCALLNDIWRDLDQTGYSFRIYPTSAVLSNETQRYNHFDISIKRYLNESPRIVATIRLIDDTKLNPLWEDQVIIDSLNDSKVSIHGAIFMIKENALDHFSRKIENSLFRIGES